MIEVTVAIGETAPPPTPTLTGVRCLHMAEGGFPHSIGDPAVRPCFDARPVEFTREMQLLAWDLCHTGNPLIQPDKFPIIYGTYTAFTNEQGYLDPADPRADWVNGRDLTCPNPKLMKNIICAGMFIPRPETTATHLICRPGVHAIDGRAVKLPDVETVLRNRWYFFAVTATMQQASHFPHGKGGPVLIPYILNEPAEYPIEWFEPWSAPAPPSPLTFYRTA